MGIAFETLRHDMHRSIFIAIDIVLLCHDRNKITK